MGEAQGVQRQRRAPDPAGPTPPRNGGAYARRSTVNGVPGERLDAVGVALALASACWYTLYILVGEYLLRGVDPLAASAYVSSGAACSFLAAAVLVGGRGLQGAAPSAYAAAAAMAVVAGAVLLPLLGGAREAVGSSLQPEYTPTRGSTRR